MKNFKLRLIALFLALTTLALVGCGGDNPPAFDAATAIADYADSVDTTVKLTYVTNYKVDVVRPGADASGMDSFKRDVVATATVVTTTSVVATTGVAAAEVAGTGAGRTGACS